MDFFEHQAQAKAASQRLLLLFLLVCFVFVLLVNGFLFISFEIHFYSKEFASITFDNFIDWQLSINGLITSLVTIAIISVGCIGRWMELSRGGHGFAIKIGARSIGFASKDEKEQKLINVVEEMAIASGVQTPGIYILENELSLNAFVAGYTLEDTVLVVTRGLLNGLNRDELQAVVGHEFSHILHGDNRINIHLLILVAGFVWVSEIGKFLITDRHYRYRGYQQKEGAFYSSIEKDEYTPKFDSLAGVSKKHRETYIPVLFIGVPIMILGYIGSFFGSLIRTAISRKREYLADASSVQFTRHPESLASALNAIRSYSRQGRLHSSRSEEISHMCISAPNKYTWFATHPPLEDRINAIDATFLKRIEVRERKEERNEARKEQQQYATPISQGAYGAGISAFQGGANEPVSEVVGSCSSENLAYAMALHHEIPQEFRNALFDTHYATVVLLFLLLDKDDQLKKQQLAFIIKQYPSAKVYLKKLLHQQSDVPRRLALPIIELMVPLLKTMSEQDKKTLLSSVLALSKWDKKLTLFELSLYTLLKDAFVPKPSVRSDHSIKKFDLVAYELNVIVCSLIHNSGGSDDEKQALHQRMMAVLSIKNMAWLSSEKIPAKDVYITLKKLKALSPMLKRTLIDVCGDIVLHDGIVHHAEYETLRLMSLVMACPMPLLPKAA